MLRRQFSCPKELYRKKGEKVTLKAKINLPLKPTIHLEP